MSVYLYEETTIFRATVHGHLENGPPITTSPPAWWPMRDEVYAAAREEIPFPPNVDFHLIYRSQDDGELCRTRWAAETEMLGPTLLWHEDTSGTSAIMFQFIQRLDIQQMRDDLERPMPWVGLRDLMPAVYAKQALGSGPVEIPYTGHDTMVFTPQEIQYTFLGQDDMRIPYTAQVCGWEFTADPTGPFEPALWIVPAGQTDGVKVSRCVDSEGAEWSDPSEPAPMFEPLPPPPHSVP